MHRLIKIVLGIISFNALALKSMDHDGLDTDVYDATKGANNHVVWATMAKDRHSFIGDDELCLDLRDKRIADIEAKIRFLQEKLEQIKHSHGLLNLDTWRELRRKNER